jgi:hypothetical protein
MVANGLVWAAAEHPGIEYCRVPVQYDLRNFMTSHLNRKQVQSLFSKLKVIDYLDNP